MRRTMTDEEEWLTTDSIVRAYSLLVGSGKHSQGSKLRDYVWACRNRLAATNKSYTNERWGWDLDKAEQLEEAVKEWAGTGGPMPVPDKVAILREVFGNPFNPGRSPLLTPDVVRLARSAYEHLLPDKTIDPLVLLALADALEESGGCPPDSLLRHLRGQELCWGCLGIRGFQANSTWVPCSECDPDFRDGLDEPWLPLRGPHYRGCWAVTLLLENSRANEDR